MRKVVTCRELFRQSPQLSGTLMLFTAALLLALLPRQSHGADRAGMNDTLNKKAAIFGAQHKKASRNLVNAAQDKTFRDYFMATDEKEKARLKAEIEKITLAVQKRFQVDEMCLIDEKGHEKCRIVFDKVAPDSDLSPDEGSAPFFKPSFEVEGRQVHIEKPYLSADSARWVIAYTTPIVLDDGRKVAILHYEMPFGDYQAALAKGFAGDDSYIVAVGKDGLAWVDSRHQYKLDGDPEKEEPASKFFPAFDDGKSPELKKIVAHMKSGATGEGTFSTGGKSYSIVYKPLGYFDWALAVVSAD